MAEPWFEPNAWSWLPGTALGVLGGLWGTACGVLGQRWPGAVIASMWVWTAASAVLLAVGLTALAQGQPYGVWYGLTLPGALGTFLGVMFLLTLRPTLLQAARQQEELRMQARDLG